MAYSEEQIPDAILLDLDMPQVDGFELLNRLDSHPVLCDVPVISMAASKDEKYSRCAYREGSSGMIYKPIKLDQLAKDIEGILKGTRTNIVSTNKRIEFYIEDRNKKLKNLIESQVFDEEEMILIGWNRGEDFWYENEYFNELINSEKLMYLEMKPSVISKFPYLQDVTPLVAEIKQF